jgi:hypothetical protein
MFQLQSSWFLERNVEVAGNPGSSWFFELYYCRFQIGLSIRFGFSAALYCPQARTLEAP